LQFKSPELYKSGARHYKISNMLSKSMLAAVAVATLTVSAAFATVPAQTSACNYQFNTNLRLGAVSTDVQNLQKLLNMDAATKVAATGAGSMGAETLRFGPATFAAVKKFQAANGIISSVWIRWSSYTCNY
jgi:peptidoglycan hydrolase-like protein with peptidoglycan-binding domain